MQVVMLDASLACSSTKDLRGGETIYGHSRGEKQSANSTSDMNRLPGLDNLILSEDSIRKEIVNLLRSRVQELDDADTSLVIFLLKHSGDPSQAPGPQKPSQRFLCPGFGNLRCLHWIKLSSCATARWAGFLVPILCTCKPPSWKCLTLPSTPQNSSLFELLIPAQSLNFESFTQTATMESDQSSQYPLAEAANNVYHVLVPNDSIQSSANFDQRNSQGCHRPSGALAHPIHALPPELISLIFVHCLPSGAASQRKLHPSTAPLLLTRICSAWRTLALRTPELWACVAFEVFHTMPPSPNSGFQSKPFELKLPMLGWWLARGADHPLTFHLHCRQHSAGLVPLLAAHTQRWADVDLFLHPTTLAAFDIHTVEMTDFELPLLRRLSLGCAPRSWPSGAGTDAALPRVTAFANAPHLTHVSLLKLSPSDVKLPWTQLTHFYASCAAVEDVARVLRLAPELQRLQLDFQQWSPSSSTIPPPPMATEDLRKLEGDPNIIHTSLKSFTLHTHPSSPIPLSVLLGPGSRLALPSLTSLNLPPVTPGDVGALVAFLSRSCLSQTLQQLTFALAPLPQDAILEILSPLKSLQRLELHFPSQVVLGDILRALVVTSPLRDDDDSRTTDDDCDAGGRTPFLPSLRELRIDCYRGKVTYAQLRTTLEARWNVGCDVAVAEAQHEGNRLHPPSASKGRSLPSHQSVAQLRTFTMTTLTPNPKTASSSPSATTVPLPARQMCPRPDSDPDERHLAALRVLQAQGMSLSVASVYGGNVV
ncbi:hypothetical protein R3P38DRAFT_695808 [Favolaschia claudopus]|uniref:F-box domain-containing protein n=1 Tax=Favolaschia claudopus TaxID=2862362 RepID=A0AAW0EBD7_9AGAR